MAMGYFVKTGRLVYNVDMNNPWEREYQNPQFLTLGTEPLSEIRQFMKWLRRDQKLDITEWNVFDAGCGNGKNLKYIIDNFCEQGTGIDISETAISFANNLKQDSNINYQVGSIGEKLPVSSNSMNLIIDATSSHVLNESERHTFFYELLRITKPESYVFLRTLCIEGDTNAKKLIADNPGEESNTYILPGLNITERVWMREDLENYYTSHFEILHMEKTTGYQKWGNQNYKRNYWIVYMKKKLT
jgi:SAM-dependent methyltransferase